MSREMCSKVYNELIDRTGIEPDKYEREDAFCGIWSDVQKGKSLLDSCVEVFDVVHGYDLPETLFKSCYANAVGFQN